MRRWKDRFWPTIDRPASTRLALTRSVKLFTVWAVFNGALGVVLIFTGNKVVTEPGAGMTKGENTISGITFLIIGAIFGQIAWKVRSMSRGWTIGGLSLAALLLLSDFTREPSPITLLIHGVVFLYFFHTLRAVLSYDRLLAEQPISERLYE